MPARPGRPGKLVLIGMSLTPMGLHLKYYKRNNFGTNIPIIAYSIRHI